MSDKTALEYYPALSAAWETDKNQVLVQKGLDMSYELGFRAAWNTRADLPRTDAEPLDAEWAEALAALERVEKDASFGIRSDDHELMDPDNYREEMQQLKMNISTIRRALTQPSVEALQEDSDPYLISLRDAYDLFDSKECDGVDECKEVLEHLIQCRKAKKS